LPIHNSKINNNKKPPKKSTLRDEQTNMKKKETEQTNRQIKKLTKNSRFRSNRILVLV
jgi:hypothetical protein